MAIESQNGLLQYPQYYDGRYRDYNAYLNDPYYFDPYRRNVSYQYANSYIPGLYDLDYYGDWRNLDGWQPQYLSRDNLYQRGVNLNVPGAVTVVSVDDFTRGTDWRRARKADRNMLASVNPVLDPLLLTPLRNAVVHSAWGRGKKDIPPGIAKKLRDTTVITSTTPVAPSFRRDVARSMRVETVDDRAKGQKFKVKDERHGKGGAQQSSREPEQRKQQRIERPAQAAQAERALKPARQQAQGERVAAPRPAPAPKHERPPQAQQKQERPAKAAPSAPRGGGKGKGKKP